MPLGRPFANRGRDAFDAVAIEPSPIHQGGSHSASAVSMATAAVVPGEEPLPVGYPARVVFETAPVSVLLSKRLALARISACRSRPHVPLLALTSGRDAALNMSHSKRESIMRFTGLALALFAILSSESLAGAGGDATSSERLKPRLRTAGAEWPMPGHNWALTRFSELSQISRETVSRLQETLSVRRVSIAATRQPPSW